MFNSPSLCAPCPFPFARDSASQNVDPTGGVLPVLVIDAAGLATASLAASVTLGTVVGMTGLATASGSSTLTAKEVAALAGLATPSAAAAAALAGRISMAGLATPSGSASLLDRDVITITALAIPGLQATLAARAVINAALLATAEGHALVITMPERIIDFAGLATATLEADATLGAVPLPPDLGLPPRMGGMGRLSVPWRRLPARELPDRQVYIEALATPTLEAAATLAIVVDGEGLAQPWGAARVRVYDRPAPVPAIPADLLFVLLEAA
jgi:hypothetical protein